MKELFNVVKSHTIWIHFNWIFIQNDCQNFILENEHAMFLLNVVSHRLTTKFVCAFVFVPYPEEDKLFKARYIGQRKSKFNSDMMSFYASILFYYSTESCAFVKNGS